MPWGRYGPAVNAVDRLLAPFLADPSRAGVLTDFDGTLAPIVDDPASARPLPDAVDTLHRLAAKYGRVAVVSGRPASFLADRLDLTARASGLVAMGLYGLETAAGDGITTDPRALDWTGLIDGVAERTELDAPRDVLVERKGLSIVVHYRTAPAAAPWATAWAIAEAARNGLVRHPARMSEELRPPVPVDKGTAVAGLIDGLAAACFLGDDAGDLPAFDVLDALAGRGGAALKVGVRSEEAPADLLARADLVVDGPVGALDVLRRLDQGAG